MTPLPLAPVWDRDELERVLRDALELVDALAPPDDLRVAVFEVGSSALLQREPDRAAALRLRELGRAPAGRA